MAKEIDIEISFSDITMAETDGEFAEVKKIMINEFPHNDKWMIQTETSIKSPFGVGEMTLNCYGNGKIFISKYNPSIGDVFYNPDITSIVTWAQEKGWQRPQPMKDLAASNKDFWKFFYDTLLVDCDYFDKIYGKREILEDE